MKYSDLKFNKSQRERKGVYLSCETCSREFYVNPARIRQVTKNNNTIRYCSMACYKKTGDANPFWGKRHSSSSVKKMVEHPNRHKFKQGEENPNFIRFGNDFVGINMSWWRRNRDRFSEVCEDCGYSIREILQIHHHDRNTKNNVRENLIILCPNCHILRHYKARDGLYNSIGRAKKNKQG